MRKATLLVTLVFLAACSTNPATGKKQFNIVSESQELAIGQQSHREIIEQFGVYDEKPELNRLVERIGRVRVSPRYPISGSRAEKIRNGIGAELAQVRTEKDGQQQITAGPTHDVGETSEALRRKRPGH